MSEQDFDSIRPFRDDEIAPAIEQIVSNSKFQSVLDFLFPGEQDKYRKIFANSKTVKDVQQHFMHKVIHRILARSSDGLSTSGFENFTDTGHTILSNHRDILLDSGILNIILMDKNFETAEITFGNNLIISPFFEQAAKVNKMITVIRDGSPRELLFNSIRLSKYISNEIINGNSSVWVAQRPGRTKDGFDKTEISILKMLSFYQKDNYYEAIKKLDIIPVSISYEWEPCDIMKIRETYLSKQNTYIKKEKEDLQSTIGGITGHKGRIHFAMGIPLNNVLDSIKAKKLNNAYLALVAQQIDKEIYKNYKLWPVNWLAYDLLEGNSIHSNQYNDSTLGLFKKRFSTIDQYLPNGNKDELWNLFLHLYANPVYNYLTVTQR
ncbi:MAG: acyltransferase [Bacteroidetes bacterium]|nr:MAG: acyltransferase [Bacteroidota bacterium]